METLTVPSLGETVERVETNRKTVRVCNVDDRATLRRLEDHFEPHDVDVVLVPDDPERSGAVVELESNGVREATSPVEAVVSYAESWDESLAAGMEREPPAVVARLNDTFFESYDKQRMIMASRIVEFRGLNVGSGTLHAGFQDLAKVDFQRSTYRHLADSGLDVHVYGAPAPETTRDLDLHAHERTDEEVALHWWVAFDGDGDDDEKAVLLAQERQPNLFYGFWTYQPGVVDDVLARMPALQ